MRYRVHLLWGFLAAVALTATTVLPAAAVGSSAGAGHSASAMAAEVITPPESAPVYRFWSDSLRVHFYTINAAERDYVAQNYSGTWRYEGQQFRAFTTQVPGSVPLYRFWSDRNGGHFYTQNQAERDYVQATYPTSIWRYEGIAYYVYPIEADVAGSSTVARFWSDATGHHFYTADSGEANYIRTTYPSSIWRFEGDTFRVMPMSVQPGDPGAPPAPPTPPAPPVPPTPPAPPTAPANPGDTKNCSDFATYAQAKAWFDTYYPWYGDVAKLDGNNDQRPCESLPGGPG